MLVQFIMVAFLQNATIEYSQESVCVCVCVFLHDYSKSNRSRNMKLEYIAVYKNISDKLDNGLCGIKVKVTVDFEIFLQYKLSGPITQLWYKLASLY